MLAPSKQMAEGWEIYPALNVLSAELTPHLSRAICLQVRQPGHLSGTDVEIGQPAAVAVDDARDKRAGLPAAEADDVVIARDAGVADVNVAAAPPVKFPPAPYPSAMLFEPPALEPSADEPIAVFWLPLVSFSSAW